jgi:4-amino-4-deoxy-L-arabinose transferase-like glycosyltransferase
MAVLLTLGDPGITVDEPLDVRPGRTYVELLMKHGPAFLAPPVVERTYRDNAEHPPLGRWLLGAASKVFEPVEAVARGGDPTGLYVRSGRVAPAVAFGVLVGRVALETARLGGIASGVGAGIGLILMPRMFAHAHLGALDTFVATFWTLALLATLRATSARRPFVALAGAGALWGLALLTKIHGWLLAPAALAWIAWRLPWRRAGGAAAVWLAAGLVVFFAGWPWLWYETGPRLVGFLRTGVERTPILVQYFGTVYRDLDVPWHYPWLYAMAAVPIGLIGFGLIGAVAGLQERRTRALVGTLLGVVAGWLTLFSTRVPVYDGERLFLPIFPLLAIVIGLGFGACWDRAKARWSRAALALLLAAQGAGVLLLHPFQLSYYNALIGGVKGAERLGLELTYWGDAIDERLLDQLVAAASPRDRCALAPTLAPQQGLTLTTPAMARREVILGDQDATAGSRWVVVFRRTAYWPEEIRQLVERSRPLATRARDGVWLSGIWDRGENRAGPN